MVVRCAILFDNEEVGSRTKQGGAGMLLPNLIKRVYDALGYSNQEMDSFISKGFMISSDVAHGLHPNYPEKNDITNIPILNKGLALKIACSQSYAGDARAIAIVKGLCEEAGADVINLCKSFRCSWWFNGRFYFFCYVANAYHRCGLTITSDAFCP